VILIGICTTLAWKYDSKGIFQGIKTMKHLQRRITNKNNHEYMERSCTKTNWRHFKMNQKVLIIQDHMEDEDEE